MKALIWLAALLGTVAFVFNVAVWIAGAADVNGPFIPRGAQLVRDVSHECPEGPVYVHAYATKPLAEEGDFDLIIIGRLGEYSVHEMPTMYKWYAPGLANATILDAYLALPGKPVRHLTDEEIQHEFPHPCAVGHALVGQPFRPPVTQ